MIIVIVKHKIKMNLTGKEKRPYIEVMQNDAFSRILEIEVQQNGLPRKLPSTGRILIRYYRPDGVKCAYDTMADGEQAWYLRENVVGILLAPEICAVAGTAVMVLEILEDRERLFSFPVDIWVKENPDVQETRAGKTYCAGYLPQPNEPQVGQFIQIQEIDERGRVIRTESASVPEGKSAYDYAKEWGYEGTEAEFAEKLAGPNTGISIGTMEPTDHSTVWIDTGEELEEPPAGKDGADGKSAYQYAMEGGYTGTEAEFAVKLAEEYPQPDWNAVEGEPGYVRNRPVYVTGTAPKTLLDTTVTVSGNQWIGKGTIPLIEGMTYTGIWNGTAYESVCYTATVMGMKAICVGNPGILQTGENNGIPFAFGCFTAYGMCAVAAFADGDYTLKITEEVPAYKQLPEDALPPIAVPWVYKFQKGAFGEVTSIPESVTITDISYDLFADFLWRGGTLIFDMTDALPIFPNNIIYPIRKKVVDWVFGAGASDASDEFIMCVHHPLVATSPEYIMIKFKTGTWLPPAS